MLVKARGGGIGVSWKRGREEMGRKALWEKNELRGSGGEGNAEGE